MLRTKARTVRLGTTTARHSQRHARQPRQQAVRSRSILDDHAGDLDPEVARARVRLLRFHVPATRVLAGDQRVDIDRDTGASRSSGQCTRRHMHMCVHSE